MMYFYNCLNIIRANLTISQDKVIEAIYPQDKCYITLSTIVVVFLVKSATYSLNNARRIRNVASFSSYGILAR